MNDEIFEAVNAIFDCETHTEMDAILGSLTAETSLGVFIATLRTSYSQQSKLANWLPALFLCRDTYRDYPDIKLEMKGLERDYLTDEIVNLWGE